ncbi:ddiA [Symbiodinium natans]|uniref:DdiA protein n=1 Tax=Symbiodinium natans TaxID=878477 RepID=A0A812TQ87_9DINO|nr:ddiA [Symbiodinium natans]
MYKHMRAKETDMCRFLVRDRVGTCKDAWAPTCASPLRLLHIIERSGVCIQYEIAELGLTRRGLLLTTDLHVVARDRVIAVEIPTEKMQEMQKGIKETLASFHLTHVKFKNGQHSPLVKQEIRWCNGLLAALVAAFTAQRYQQEVKEQADRKGIAALVRDSKCEQVKAVQDEVLPKHGLAAEDYDWRTIQWKLWFYGLLDDSNVRLANEAMLASQVRICGLLPWKKAGITSHDVQVNE